MVVTFNITGIAGNLKPTAATSHIAGLEFADESWAVNHWSSLSGDKYDATIHDDGTYKVWMETTSNAAGAKVFCIDIKNLATDLIDSSKLKVNVISVDFDR